jgi:hypothetical protein
MKKVLGKMSAFIFGGFGIAVLALLMSLTYGALQHLFPGNFSNQMWGMVMFDIAAMCWALAFVFQSKSTMQYAASGIGFVVGFVGTLGMVAAEVMLSGTTLTPEQIAQIAKWMTYGFIIVTALHAALIYAHHAGAPDIAEQINVGVARGEIVTEAISQATKTLETQKAELAQTIHQDIVSQVKRDLGLYPVQGTPFEPKKFETAPLPVTWEDAPATARPLSSRFKDWVNNLGKPTRYEQTMQEVKPVSIENANETWQRNGAIMGWKETPAGRVRLWCLACQEDGQAWLSPTPCEHILNAEQQEQIPTAEGLRTRDELIEEYGQKLEAKTEATYHPVPLEPSASRPLYHRDDGQGEMPKE